MGVEKAMKSLYFGECDENQSIENNLFFADFYSFSMLKSVNQKENCFFSPKSSFLSFLDVFEEFTTKSKNQKNLSKKSGICV